MKTCTKCNKTKPKADFYKRKALKSGYNSWCKDCEKNNASTWSTNNKERRIITARKCNLKIKYGLTIEEYNGMLKEQDYRCLICHNKQETKMLAVDHNHTTNKIRGLLCTNCNTIIGLAHDDVNILESAIKYLSTK